MEYKITRRGQERLYGDSVTVYEITTDCNDKAEVLKFCKEVIMKGKDIPERHERRYSSDPYYTLVKTEGGWDWELTIVYPYDD